MHNILTSAQGWYLCISQDLICMKTFLTIEWSIIAISRLPERIILYSVFFCPFKWINQNIFLNMFQLFYYSIQNVKPLFLTFQPKDSGSMNIVISSLMRHLV